MKLLFIFSFFKKPILFIGKGREGMTNRIFEHHHLKIGWGIKNEICKESFDRTRAAVV